MHSYLENLSQNTRGLSMARSEKRAIRVALYEFMDKHPLSVPQPEESRRRMQQENDHAGAVAAE